MRRPPSRLAVTTIAPTVGRVTATDQIGVAAGIEVAARTVTCAVAVCPCQAAVRVICPAATPVTATSGNVSTVAILVSLLVQTALSGTRPRLSRTLKTRSSPTSIVVSSGAMWRVAGGVDALSSASVSVRLRTFDARSVAWMITLVPPTGTVASQENAIGVTVAATPLQVTPTSPDSTSSVMPVTTTVPADTTAPGTGDMTDSKGSVLSMRTVTVVFAVCPASSEIVRVISCTPSVSIAIGSGQTIVDGPTHVKETVTAVLFQPFAFGAGKICPAMAMPLVSVWVTVTSLVATVSVAFLVTPVVFAVSA